MIVAGGIYYEACTSPPTRSLLGSGGRAALALAGLTSDVTLHGFYPAKHADEAFSAVAGAGVDLHLHPAPDRIAFDYLHPLARPRIFPIPLPNAGTIEVAGRNILRFGCLEGDFRVNAEKVVYDPQSCAQPEPFPRNGSRAGSLAVVLNRVELQALTGSPDEYGARTLIERDGASVAVVKCGPAGALVVERGGQVSRIPAFETRAVHKIGSGDVFSAVFALMWAERDLAPEEAASHASLHAAQYVENRILPLDPSPRTRRAAEPRPTSRVAVWTEDAGMSATWVREEALAALGDLLPGEAGCFPTENLGRGDYDVAFLIITKWSARATQAIMTANGRARAVIVFAEAPPSKHATALSFTREPDFATSLYRAAWA